jgi:hypothetical protein
MMKPSISCRIISYYEDIFETLSLLEDFGPASSDLANGISHQIFYSEDFFGTRCLKKCHPVTVPPVLHEEGSCLQAETFSRAHVVKIQKSTQSSYSR